MTPPAALIEWDAPSPALAANFLRYWVQRLTPLEDGWHTIAYVNTEATLSFPDYAARRGVEESYRVLVERTDEVTSIASSIATITLPPTPYQHWLVSNHQPDLNVELTLTSDPYDVPMPEPADVIYTSGRTAARVFRADPYSPRLAWLAHALSDQLTGTRVWADLLAIARADLPHVSVLTAEGERYEAAVLITQPRLVSSTAGAVPLDVIDVGEPVPVEVP